jgi:hypothetical protein
MGKLSGKVMGGGVGGLGSGLEVAGPGGRCPKALTSGNPLEMPPASEPMTCSLISVFENNQPLFLLCSIHCLRDGQFAVQGG